MSKKVVLSIIGFLALQSSGLQAYLSKEQLLEKADEFFTPAKAANARTNLFYAAGKMLAPMKHRVLSTLQTLRSHQEAQNYYQGLDIYDNERLFEFCDSGCLGVLDKIQSKYSSTIVLSQGILARLNEFERELTVGGLSVEHVKAMFLLYRWGYLPALDCARAQKLDFKGDGQTITGLTTQNVNLDDRGDIPARSTADFANFYRESLIPALDELMAPIRAAQEGASGAPSPSVSATPPGSLVAHPFPAPVPAQDFPSDHDSLAYELGAIQALKAADGQDSLGSTVLRSPGRSPRRVHFAQSPVAPPLPLPPAPAPNSFPADEASLLAEADLVPGAPAEPVCLGCNNGFVIGSGLSGPLSMNDLCQMENCPFAGSALSQLSSLGAFEDSAPPAPAFHGLGSSESESSESDSDDGFGRPSAPAPFTRGRGRGGRAPAFPSSSSSSSSSSFPPALPQPPAEAFGLPQPPAPAPAPVAHAAPVDFAAVASEVEAGLNSLASYRDSIEHFKANSCQAWRAAPGVNFMNGFCSQVDIGGCKVSSLSAATAPGILSLNGLTLNGFDKLHGSAVTLNPTVINKDGFGWLNSNLEAANLFHVQGTLGGGDYAPPYAFLAAGVTHHQRAFCFFNHDLSLKTGVQEVSQNAQNCPLAISSCGLDFQKLTTKPDVLALFKGAAEEFKLGSEGFCCVQVQALADAIFYNIFAVASARGAQVIGCPLLGFGAFLRTIDGAGSHGMEWNPDSGAGVVHGLEFVGRAYGRALRKAMVAFPGIQKVYISSYIEQARAKTGFEAEVGDISGMTPGNRLVATDRNLILLADKYQQKGIQAAWVNASDWQCLMGKEIVDLGKFHKTFNSDNLVGEELAAAMTTLSLNSRGMCPEAWERAQPVGLSPAR